MFQKDVEELRKLAVWTWGRSTAGKRNSQCKGPGVGTCLGYPKNHGNKLGR